MTPVTLLQLSDCHLTPQAGQLFRGVDPRQTLAQVIRHVQQSGHQFDHLLLSGDLVHHGDAGVYQELLQQLAVLELPTTWLAGNHDDLQVMQQAADLDRFSVSLGPWQLLCLDSNHAPDGRGSGAIASHTLERLSRQLAADRRFTLLALHHNPLASGTEWQDQIMLSNASELWQCLAQAPHCKAIICGHLHQPLHWQHQGVSVWSAPSTAVQFCPGSAQVEVAQQPPESWPGYRWYQLWPDGRIDAHFESVPLRTADQGEPCPNRC
ncbi:3',5'-cyclic-nucleotide phosphodiesterase [Nitrincola lacisaponensis]|uniref:3',5'-cyclic-nucleotide phosphodiesterase n=1 Tax=Nitrincola lacisaponensis TaxID=267850 RepID=A0A063Y3S4_9GAMM|nr:metallophosphoesterase [Nitrincola lacisaponensis]KDE40339.1 3',5'-cyclic-nucleotide phosphodiesterase [Nitrincola lacisaponensis]